MNKSITILTFFILLATSSFAQDKGFYYGTRFSLGESDLSSSNLENTTGKLFWQAGAASAYQFTKNIGLTADFLLSGKGTKNTGNFTSASVLGTTERKYDQKISLLRGDVPITLKLSANVEKLYFKAYAGPNINFQLAGVHTLQYEDEDYNDDNGFENADISNNFETMTLGMLFGAGIDVKAGDGRIFFLDFRYSPSSTVGTWGSQDLKSNFIGLSTGYLFH